MHHATRKLLQAFGARGRKVAVIQSARAQRLWSLHQGEEGSVTWTETGSRGQVIRRRQRAPRAEILAQLASGLAAVRQGRSKTTVARWMGRSAHMATKHGRCFVLKRAVPKP